MPVIAGLAAGILIIALFGFLSSYVFPNYPVLRLYPSNYHPNWWMSSSWIGITKGLDEIKIFLEHYPQAKTIVYSNTRFVEYSVYDNVTAKFVSLRIMIAPDSSVSFVQATCVLVDRETQEAINREDARVEKKGPPLSHFAEFLQDERCPR